MSTETGEDPALAEEQSADSPLRRDWDLVRGARGVAGIVGFVAVWWVASLFQRDIILPGPAAVAEAFVAEFQSGAMLTALRQSMLHWIPGTIVGTAIGIGLGVALAWSDAVDDAFAPLVRILRPVPPLALIGFAIAWFGLNHVGAAFIIAVGGLWINFYASYGAVEGVSEELIEVAESLGASSNVGVLRKVVLPAALPGIATGIRTGIGRSWMLVVAAEIFGVPGVGHEIFTASQNLAVDVVIAYILVLSLVYLVVDAGFRALQSEVIAWRA